MGREEKKWRFWKSGVGQPASSTKEGFTAREERTSFSRSCVWQEVFGIGDWKGGRVTGWEVKRALTSPLAIMAV